MAIQFSTATSADNFSIATPNNSIGAGQSAMSVHFAFQVNVALTNTSVNYIFAQGTFNGFEITIESSSGLNFANFTLSGPSGTAQFINFQFQPGTPYFVDMVWTSNLQTFYVNGIQQATRTVAGLTFSGQSIHIGCSTGSTGLSLTLSNIAVWDGYALTAADAVNLMTGTYTPETLVGSGTMVLEAAAWCPTLTGTLGHTPTAGDSGLDNHLGTATNGSGNVNVLSSFSSTAGGSAQYVADLIWTPLPLTTYVNSSGQALVIGASATGGLPTSDAAITAVSSPPTVSVNGSPATLGSAVWGDASPDLPFVMYQFLSPTAIAPTDVVTYSMPFQAITTSKLGPSGPVTNAPVTNCVGRYEPGFNGCTGFQPSPTMGNGYCGIGGFYSSFCLNPARNLRLRFPVMSGVTYDATYQPLYWTPGATVTGLLWSFQFSNGVDTTFSPLPAGVYSFVFEDANALDATNHLKVWLVGNQNTCAGSDLSSGPATGTGNTYIRTVVPSGVGNGGTVTVSYWITYTSVPNTHGYELDFHVYMSSVSGYFSQAGSSGAPGSGPISNFWMFSPGDSTTTAYSPYTGPFPNSAGNDRSDPLAVSAYHKLALVSSNGNGIATVRPQGFSTGMISWQVPADMPNANFWSYAQDIVPTNYVPISATAAVTNGSQSVTFSTSQTIANNTTFTFDSSGQTYLIITGGTGTAFTISPPYQGTTSGTAPVAIGRSTTVTISSIRPYNVNPSNANYSWVSSKVYHPLLGFDGNDYPTVGGNNPAAGNYMDLTTRPTMVTGEQNWMGYLEAICSAPHPYRTGDFINFPVAASVPYLAITGGPNQWFPGTISATNGSGSITFSTSQTLVNNTYVSITDWSPTYLIATGGTGTVFTLSATYGGTTNTAASVTIVPGTIVSGTAAVTNGSATITFSKSQTIANNTSISISNSTGHYKIATGGTGTAFTVSPVFAGQTTTGATAVLQFLPSPSGTVTVTNNSTTVTFSQTQTIANNTWWWFTGSNQSYLIATGGTGTAFTISPAFGGATSSSAIAVLMSGAPLPGTATIANGGTTVTFSQTQTIVANQSFTFDSSGYAYTIGTGGTGTVFTLSAPYRGTGGSGLTATIVASVEFMQNRSTITVTAADKFVFGSGATRGLLIAGGGTIGLPQQLLATGPIAVNVGNISPFVDQGFGVTEFWANLCAGMGTSPWLLTMPYMTDACLEQYATVVAAHSPPGTIVKFELGDEHWNGTEPLFGLCGYYGNLMQFVAPNTFINEYYTTPVSPVALTPDTAYMLMLAHHHKVLQDKFDALRSGITVERLFGSHYNGTSVTAALINTAVGNVVQLTKKIPVGSLAIAPYQQTSTSNTTFTSALASWPTSLINDLSRLVCKYSLTFWNTYGGANGHATYIANYKANGGPSGYAGQVNGSPTLRGYESGWEGSYPSNDLPPVHDQFYDPGPYPPYTGFHGLITAYMSGMQDGDPRIPGSGLTQCCYQSLEGGWGTNFWLIAVFNNQPAGDGMGNLYPTFVGKGLPAGSQVTVGPNQFCSPQGGPAGSQGRNVSYDLWNQSVGLQALLDWAAVANSQPSGPSTVVISSSPNAATPNTFAPNQTYPQISAGGSLAAGTVTLGRIGNNTIAASSTAATGGTAPYTYQWQYNWPRGGAGWLNATGTGISSTSAVIQNLGPSASYLIREKVTDAGSNVAYSSVVSASTLGLRWFPGLARSKGR